MYHKVMRQGASPPFMRCNAVGALPIKSEIRAVESIL